jgi:UDPglucose 6-dehydrogenase
MKIAIIGAGYVGLVTAACFAKLGHTVSVINRDPAKAAAINAGHPPIHEQGLAELLANHVGSTLVAGTDYAPVGGADQTFICVGTPSREDGSADLDQVEAASRSVGEALAGASRPHVVVVKSTVPPGTTDRVVALEVYARSGRADIGFAMNPEFLREGRAVDDFLHPDRIVIGADSTASFERVAAAYQGVDAPVLRTGTAAAEMIKYASNAFLATKISYANEVGNICKRLGVDVYEVMKGVGMDQRISPHFLNAGAGFGGSCFPKDVSALIHLAGELGEEPRLLRSVMEVNDRQPLRMVAMLEDRLGPLEGRRIAVLGLAFKDNTDDIRDSRSIPVIGELLRRGASIAAYDPLAIPAMQALYPAVQYAATAKDALDGADACLVMTEWPEFSLLDAEAFAAMRSQVIIEGRRILTCGRQEGLCW